MGLSWVSCDLIALSAVKNIRAAPSELTPTGMLICLPIMADPVRSEGEIYHSAYTIPSSSTPFNLVLWSVVQGSQYNELVIFLLLTKL